MNTFHSLLSQISSMSPRRRFSARCWHLDACSSASQIPFPHLTGTYSPFPLNIPAINSPYGYWFQALLKILHFRFKSRYMQKNVTKLATLQAQPKPRAFHPYLGLQQAEAFIVHLLMQKKYQIIQVWEGRRVKGCGLCWKPSAAHTQHPSGSPAWLPGHAHQEEFHTFSPNIREQWRD